MMETDMPAELQPVGGPMCPWVHGLHWGVAQCGHVGL